jgi:hypothetical protein
VAPLDSMIDWVAGRLARIMPSPGKETQFERCFFMPAAGARRGSARLAEGKWGQ